MQADLELRCPKFAIRKQSVLSETIKIALQQFINRPLVSLLTIVILAVMLVLPMSLFWLLNNMPTALQSWHHSPKMALYLKPDVTAAQAETLLQQIEKRNDVAKVVYISPEQGLKDLTEQTKINVTDKLSSNPLPGVIIVLPKGLPSTTLITQLGENFKALSQVEQVQFNKSLMEQRYSWLQLAWQGFYFFGGLFGAIAVVIIALQLQLNFRDNFGALFFNGIFYGLSAGLLTWILLAASLSNFAEFIRIWMGVSGDLSSHLMGKFLLLSMGLGLIGASLASGLLLIHSSQPEQPIGELGAHSESEPAF